jgi:phosphoribosylamine-glycine ligase
VAENLSDAITKAYDAASAITYQGAHFRKDIAAKALRKSFLYPSNDN